MGEKNMVWQDHDLGMGDSNRKNMLSLIVQANASRPQWSRSTLCQRLLGDPTFWERFRDGRITVATMNRHAVALREFIDREAQDTDGE